MADHGDLRHDPIYWRGRAAEVRATADQMKTAQARQEMLDVAEGYERMAERVERRHST